MDGLIHQSFKGLVLSKYGERTWDTLIQSENISNDSFIATREYSDSLLFRMIESTSDLIDVDSTSLLREFGYHFIMVTARENYRSMIRFHGSSGIMLLKNLNAMHARLKSTFVNYEAPVFEVCDVQERSCTLIYLSKRSGLKEFVVGLIRGVADFYNEKIELLDQGHGRDGELYKYSFKITWRD
jgi:hypothetical protein